MSKIWYFIIGIFILLIIAGYFFYETQFKDKYVSDSSDDDIPADDSSNNAGSSTSNTNNLDSNIICDSDTYNCDDFATCEDVMEVFNECGTDIHKLDNDGDGVPCEGLCSG